MDNHDNHLKPQQTGGLKLMTVFIAVLALHVVVIGGITVYHLMSGGNSDGDLVDKTHKNVKVASEGDGSLPDGTSPDKNSTTPATPAPANPPGSESTASTEAGASTPTPTPAPVTPAPEPTPAPESTAANPPTGPIPSGPVITPAPGSSPTPADITASPTPSSAPTALDGDLTAGTSYVVKSRDSLARIAHQHHTTVAKLRAANSLKSDLLQIGQKLTLPGATTETASVPEPVKPAPASTPAPAASTGPNRTLLGDSIPEATNKPVAATGPDQTAVAPAVSSRHSYTVMKGDTLSKIAHKFHTTTGALMAANGSVDARKLRIGQKLRIPSQEPRSATSAPTPAPQPQQPDHIEPRATPSAQLANFMP